MIDFVLGPRRMLVSTALVVGALFWSSAAGAVDFSGKTISMIVGAAPAGGTDATARLIAPFFERYLPGNPTIIVHNMPGAGGVTALNYVVQQTKPDGLTLIGGGNAQLSPVTYRKSHGVYDPRKFRYIGGIGRGGTVVIVNTEHEKRLYDRRAAPLFFGALDGTRSGELIAFWAMEYLGWNAKVVVGYPGTNEIVVAMDRGEVDMNATGNLFQFDKLLKSGRFRILLQSGTFQNGKFRGRPEFGDAPVFIDMMADKITDPVAKEAFRYWEAFMGTDKWLGLVEGTPDDILAVYRAAFNRTIKDRAFLERATKISEDMSPMSYEDMELLANQLAGSTDEAADYIKQLQRKHGLNVK
jgi:tripartite-type tricarboxylate transporter receptor subunit TctC